ncbi:hypothetical protein CCY99_03885 [Helicobacter sp. 16-1353]|uniref:LTA synthase family protein n=1 Tax=Helicobacter sp. 16-1353 TaxID=2004996 RepID=UPI000DCBCC70|nr:LTA synthase family protein [Helicobacter sp. 16-1353]RAX54498.1 hypothetical protein CCY99_03885 [Helicobacter sp. 16-1353]
MPLDGADPRIILSMGKNVLLPTFIFSLLILFLLLSSPIQRLIFTQTLRFLRFIFSKLYLARFYILSLAVLIFGALSVKYTNDKFGIYEYFTKKQEKHFSTFYEEHYTAPSDLQIRFPEKKRNLIIVYLESMEATFARAFDRNLIPNLSQIATQNISTNLIQTNGVGWTVAAMVGYECGINLKMPIGGNDFRNKYFLSSATCLGDILKQAGYRQDMVLSEGNTGGKINFLKAHGLENVYDLEYFRDSGKLPKKYHINWGMEDAKTFEFAKEILSNYDSSTPFVLRIESVDAHFPGYVDSSCMASRGNQYADSISCSDKMLGEFIAWLKAQDFYKNTTIVVLGDHYTMQRGFVPNGVRRGIYNAIINPPSDLKIDSRKVKNRNASHFDMLPSILESIGIEVEGRKAALGVSLFSDKPTLLESMGLETLNQNLSQNNRIYDSFWQVKK